MDALTTGSDSPTGRTNLFFLPGAARMLDDPHVRPNDAGLELLREISNSLRGVEAGVASAREELAELRGVDLPRRVREHDTKLHEHHDRLGALEVINTAAADARRPWVFVLAQFVTALVAAAVGAASAWWAGPHS